jgi:hypothetical protein
MVTAFTIFYFHPRAVTPSKKDRFFLGKTEYGNNEKNQKNHTKFKWHGGNLFLKEFFDYEKKIIEKFWGVERRERKGDMRWERQKYAQKNAQNMRKYAQPWKWGQVGYPISHLPCNFRTKYYEIFVHKEAFFFFWYFKGSKIFRGQKYPSEAFYFGGYFLKFAKKKNAQISAILNNRKYAQNINKYVEIRAAHIPLGNDGTREQWNKGTTGMILTQPCSKTWLKGGGFANRWCGK